jgi:hypothetical protein
VIEIPTETETETEIERYATSSADYQNFFYRFPTWMRLWFASEVVGWYDRKKGNETTDVPS